MGEPRTPVIRLLAWLAAGLMVATLASCASGSDPSSPPNTGSTPESGWYRRDVRLADDLQSAGGRIGFVDATKTELSLTVLDGRTGATLWRQPWNPSAQLDGMGPGSPAMFETVVVGLTFASGDRTAIVGYVPGSGEELWRDEVLSALAPKTCGRLVCVEESPGIEGEARLTARDPMTGSVVWTRSGTQEAEISSADLLVVVELGDRPVLTSLDGRNGSERWTVDLDAATGADLDTFAGGWHFRLIDGVVVGWVADKSDRTTPAVTMALDAGSGELRWARPGAALCLLELDEVLLCRGKGGISAVSLTSGEDLWTVDEFRLPGDRGPLYGVSPNQRTFFGTDREGRAIAVDLATGLSEPVTAPALGWSVMRGEEFEGRRSPGSATVVYTGVILETVPWDWEAGTAYPVGQVGDAEIPELAGRRIRGMRVIADSAGGIHGVPLRSVGHT